MVTLSAKRVNEALQRARNVGLLEESFEICGCEVVVRNLRPDEYGAVIHECKDLEEVDYLYQFQRSHISRAICELNGVNLRDVDFIEVEEEDPKKPDHTRTVKLERHTYIEKYVVRSWGKEALFTAYRKFGDVVNRAEDKAKENVTFLTPDETSEDRFRRLLGDLKEVEDDLPQEAVDHLLEEHGYARKVTLEEARKAMERADELAKEQAKQRQTPEKELTPVISPVESKPVVPETPKIPETPVEIPATPSSAPSVDKSIEERLRTRVPLNQQPDIVAAPTTEIPVTGRGKEIAELEGIDPSDPSALLVRPVEVAEIRKQPKIDPVQVGTILDRPPTVGINPKFRPPVR